MFFQTKGIVFHATKYSDNSLIVKIYTETFGLQSYLIRSARSKKSKMKIGVFQPLSLLDITVSHDKKPGLQFIKEITLSYPFTDIPFNIKKSSIAIFLTEVLSKSIKEEEQNTDLFHFLYNAIIDLDNCKNNVSEFHLFFLLALSKYLGFYPQNNYDDSNKLFSLYDGRFINVQPEHPYYLDMKMSKCFHQFISIAITNTDMLFFSSAIKKEILNKLIDYYTIHIHGFNKLKSLSVLEEVFQ